MKVYVVSTCNPGDRDPCLPLVFTNRKKADARLEEAMREEWDAFGLEDEDGEPLPYPGEWRKAQEMIIKNDRDLKFGAWEITTQHIDISDDDVAADAANPEFRIDRLVQNEVLAPASMMVESFALLFEKAVPGWVRKSVMEFDMIAEKANELMSGTADYVAAAEDAGWTKNGSVWIHDDFAEAEVSAEAACQRSQVEPTRTEPSEYLVVTPWLAGQLTGLGETVVEIVDLHVWARMSAGAVKEDPAIIKIAATMS